MKHIRKAARRQGLLIACALLMCACANNLAGIEDRGAATPANAGYVAVQTVTNTGQLADRHKRWTGLYVSNVATHIHR